MPSAIDILSISLQQLKFLLNHPEIPLEDNGNVARKINQLTNMEEEVTNVFSLFYAFVNSVGPGVCTDHC